MSIAYLMWHYKMKLRDAYEFVKSRRPIAHPAGGTTVGLGLDAASKLNSEGRE